MKPLLLTRLLALGIVLSAIGAAATLVAAAQAKPSSPTRVDSARTIVALRKTALGSVLVDGRGHTLYLFEKDRQGVSMCNNSCVNYWPPLTSQGTPRAGSGVHQSLLKLNRPHGGARQVTYAGHPLYTFVADKHAGQTSGEGLNNFGAEWYALAASGQKVERGQSARSGSGSTGGYSSGVGW
jgi:predicted lipoprotein with Yx(FWY)xxD motif